MKKIARLCCIFILLPFYLFPQQRKTVQSADLLENPIFSEKRFALVIGNVNYANEKLINPVNDANDVSKVLKDLNFQVTTLLNANKKRMDQAIDDFAKQVEGADAALIYFAGHGVEVEGKKYIVPIDNQNIQTQTDVKYDAISTDDILQKVAFSECKTNIFIFDMCRNNPLPAGPRSLTRSLAVKKVPTEMQSIVVFSTASGETAEDGAGRNSPFTASFLQHITSPGDIRIIMGIITGEIREKSRGRQTPSTTSTLTRNFFMTGIATEADMAFIRPPSLREKMLQEETERGKFLKRSSILLSGVYSSMIGRVEGFQTLMGGGVHFKLSPWEFSWYPVSLQIFVPAYSFSTEYNKQENIFLHSIEAGLTVGYGVSPYTFFGGASLAYILQETNIKIGNETMPFGLTHNMGVNVFAGIRYRISLELAVNAEYKACFIVVPFDSPAAFQQKISLGLQYKFPYVFEWGKK